MTSKIHNNSVSLICDLDLEQYLGKWYEIAKYSAKFQDGLDNVTATYTLKDNDKIKVLNKGYKDGKEMAYDQRVTTGSPQKLSLTLNESCIADGSQCALFTCEALDENGIPVPDASEFVEFFTGEGATILGTGSDPCDHTAVTEPNRKMYMGKISIAVRPEANSEYFELYAKSDKLGYCKIKVEL